MILELHRQGLSVAAIARETGRDVKTIRRYIARGLEPPAYGPRPPRACRLDPYKAYLQERIAAYPQLSGRRLLRDIRDLGYGGAYTAVTDFLRTVRPAPTPSFEVRFETPPASVAPGVLLGIEPSPVRQAARWRRAACRSLGTCRGRARSGRAD
jgi:transposase